MNEKAVNKVISSYAIENANLRMTVANLQIELEELRVEKENEDKGGS